MQALMNAPDLSGGRNPGAAPGLAAGGGLAPGLGGSGIGGDDPMAAMLNALTQQLTGGQSPNFPPGAGAGAGAGFPPMPPIPGLGSGMGMGFGSQTSAFDSPPKPKSLFSRLRPVLHVVLTWLLLGYFAFVVEPGAYGALSVPRGGGGVGEEPADVGIWGRWAGLGRGPSREVFGVQPLVSGSFSFANLKTLWLIFFSRLDLS